MQPAHRRWGTSYPETARAKPAPCGSNSSDDGESEEDNENEGRFAPRQEAREEIDFIINSFSFLPLIFEHLVNEKKLAQKCLFHYIPEPNHG